MLWLISDANVEYVFTHTVKLGYNEQKIHFLVLNDHLISYICLTVTTNSRTIFDGHIELVITESDCFLYVPKSGLVLLIWLVFRWKHY